MSSQTRLLLEVTTFAGGWDGQGIVSLDGCAFLGCCGVAPSGLHADVIVPFPAVVE